jgi:predicted kinase
MNPINQDRIPADPNKPIAYVLVGLPGSGKSTWAAAHPERLPIASTDVFIEAYAAETASHLRRSLQPIRSEGQIAAQATPE